MRNTIQTKSGNFVYISTCYTPDKGWETMVFECDKNGEVVNYLDLDAERYDDVIQAFNGHLDMVDKWKQK